MGHSLLASFDLTQHGLGVVVDALGTDPAEEVKAPPVGVEEHLLALAGIGLHQKHAAVAKADVGKIDLYPPPGQLGMILAPVKLKGLARPEAQRNENRRGQPRVLIAPPAHVAPHAVVATFVAQHHQILEEHLSRATPLSGKLLALLQKAFQVFQVFPMFG